MKMWLIALVAILSVFCSRQHPGGSDPKTGGLGARLWTSLARPQPLHAQKLKTFVATLGSYNSCNPVGSLSSDEAATVAQKAYVAAINRVGGIPREQGADVFRGILASPSGVCQKASCEAVFGLTARQVDGFLDQLLVKAGGLPHSAERDLLIASLTPSAAFQEPQSSFDFVATIFHRKPQELPPVSAAPTGILKAPVLQAQVGSHTVSAIQNYTIGGYQISRRVETMTVAEAQKDGISPIVYDLWKKHVVKINRGLEALPHVEQNVYRGINMVPIDTVARWVRKWKNQEPIFLGPEDRPALTSATWDIEVAKTFFVIGAFSPSRHVPHLSVMFEIVQHRGVSIQSVSRSPGEHEVLLPSQSKFQIEDISPLSGFRQAVYVKVRGLSAL